MKLLKCPLNGIRNVQEFVCGGDVKIEPTPDAAIIDWSDFVFGEDNRSDCVAEWWCHIASGYWFIVSRNRSSNAVVATFTVGEYFASDSGAVE